MKRMSRHHLLRRSRIRRETLGPPVAEPHTTIEIAVAVVAVAVIVEIPTRLTGKIWDVGGGMIQKTGLEVRLVVIARDRGA